MDRLTRHDLKTDKFVEEVGQTVHFLEAHRSQAIRYGGIALAVLLVAGGGYWYMQNQKALRQQALYNAMETYNARVMPEAPPEGMKAFKSQAEKDAALAKELGEVMAKYSGSDEADVATYLSGVAAADAGRLDEAERHLKAAAGGGCDDYASLAKLSLAQIYTTGGKTAEAEKVLREVIAKPTILVTKEQATLNLARLLAKSKPEEAKKLLEPLRTAPGSASRAAIQAYAEIGTK